MNRLGIIFVGLSLFSSLSADTTGDQQALQRQQEEQRQDNAIQNQKVIDQQIENKRVDEQLWRKKLDDARWDREQWNKQHNR